jgi:hypothetical protein
MNLLYGKDTITVYGDISGKPRDWENGIRLMYIALYIHLIVDWKLRSFDVSTEVYGVPQSDWTVQWNNTEDETAIFTLSTILSALQYIENDSDICYEWVLRMANWHK